MRRDLYEDLYILEDKHWWHISKRRAVFNLIKEYNDVNKPKILDVGCGTGRNLKEFKKLGVVFGLDNSLDALKYCRKRDLKNLILGSAEKTTLKSDYFDIITLLDVLEHTDDIKTLKEMRRIIKESGLLIITVPALSLLWSEWDKVLHHKRRYNLKSLTKILQENNFKIIRTTYLYSFLVLPILIVRKIKKKFFNESSYPSDFQLSNPILNKVLCFLANFEFKLSQIISIPIGTTLLVVAKK